MLYRKISDFLEDWKNDSEATLKIFNAVTDKSLGQKVTEEGRTLGFIAWHITQSLPEMINRTGLSIDQFDENEAEPGKIDEIKSKYQYFAKKISEAVSGNWKDEDLEKEVNMYGQMWKNGLTLQILINHQIHHRAQLTILMRQAGLKVPGVMGPSKEEWEAYGMPPQK